MLELSLRARLLAGMGLVVVALVVVALIVTSTTRAYLIDQVDDRLARGRRSPVAPGPARARPGGRCRRRRPSRPSDFYVGDFDDDRRS